MVVVYGTKLCGRVDHVPGVFYVATKFAHCWYLPLVPLGSYAVFTEGSEEFHGIPIRLSGKSIFWGYLRGGVILYGFLSILFGLVSAGTGDEAPSGFFSGDYLPFIVALACFVGVWASKWLTRPSRLRAYEHAIEAGVDRELVAYHFDAVDAEQAAKEEEKQRREQEKQFPRARVAKVPRPEVPSEPAKEVEHTLSRADEDMKKGPSILG